MKTTEFTCPRCNKLHGIREVTIWAPESDNVLTQLQIEEAEFYDTEALNARPDFKADLEEEYGRSPDFVFGPYTGWCLRSEDEQR